MAHDYRQLYQHMAKSSSSLLPELSAEANPFRNRLAESEASNDGIRAHAVTLPQGDLVLRTRASVINLFFGRSNCALLFSPSPPSFNLVSHC